jgi:hypothetical protein
MKTELFVQFLNNIIVKDHLKTSSVYEWSHYLSRLFSALQTIGYFRFPMYNLRGAPHRVDFYGIIFNFYLLRFFTANFIGKKNGNLKLWNVSLWRS